MTLVEVIQFEQNSDLAANLTRLQEAYRVSPVTDFADRIDCLDRLYRAVLDHKKRIIAALYASFGGRWSAKTLLVRTLPLHEGARFNKRHLRTGGLDTNSFIDAVWKNSWLKLVNLQLLRFRNP